MPIIEVPGHGQVEFPDDMSDEQIVAAIKKNSLGYKREPEPVEPPGIGSSIAQGIGNTLAGAVRGAGSIGATILAPYDMAKDALAGKGLSLESNRQRRADMDSGLRMMGANPESMLYQGGKLAGEIAGTAGAGGVVANTARAIPAVASRAAPLLSAIESGGLVLGKPAAPSIGGKVADLATRAAGGATLGGISAGMTDPETAGTGAVIGSAVPGGMMAAKAVGSGIQNATGSLARNVLGAMTGTGSEAVKTAFNAGKSGNQTFIKNMRGQVDMTDVLDDAKNALGRIREERSNAYRSGMFDIQADKTVLDMSPVLKAADDAMADTMYKGVVKKENAAKMSQKMKEVVDEWGSLDPAEYHTPEGLDALKQRIGDLRDGTAFGSPERRVADNIYNSIKRQIQDQAPTYSKVMRDYSEATELINEVERSLVGKEKTSADTAMRKLQSLMRNNVNTNYGNRLDLAQQLEQRGADILPAVAGQAMSSVTPRGLQGVAATGTGLLGMTNPAALAVLPFQSPRLVGEAAYALGRAGWKVAQVPQKLLARTSAPQLLSTQMNYGLLAVPPVLMATSP